MPPKPPQNDRAPAPRIGRQPVEQSIFGARVVSMPLPGDVATIYLGHVTEIVTRGSAVLGSIFAAYQAGEIDVSGTEEISTEVIIKLLNTIAPKESRALVELITEIAPTLVASTTVIVDGTKYELGNADHRASLLDDRPDLYLPCAIFAGRVTYQRFFPASALRDAVTRARSASKASKPST